ncbi:MAG TPA: hypothetical protein V6C97_21990 [Oculatellaceae cyanobacterium]
MGEIVSEKGSIYLTYSHTNSYTRTEQTHRCHLLRSLGLYVCMYVCLSVCLYDPSIN